MEMPEYEESPAKSSQESFWVVEFKGNRREHFSNPNSLEFKLGDFVIVQVERGEDIGRVTPGGFQGDLQPGRESLPHPACSKQG
jgi:hypothetical protein